MPGFLDKTGFEHFVDARIGHTDYTMFGGTISEALMNSGGSRIGINLEKDSTKTITDVVVKATQGSYVLTKAANTATYVEFAGFRELTPITVTVSYKLNGADAFVSDTVEIENYSLYTVSFILGGDVWDGWLKTSNITKKYTSFEELLADDQAMKVLFANHASIDYFVEWCSTDSTLWPQVRDLKAVVQTIGKYDYSWEKIQEISGAGDYLLDGEYWEYILKDKVPVMTGDTTPSGTVIYSSQYNATDYAAFKVFDNNYSTTWVATGTGETPQYCGYKFETPTNISKVTFTPTFGGGYGTRVKNYIIQSSNDGVTWNDLYSGVVANETTRQDIVIELENEDYYLYYRLYISDTYGASMSLMELQFYGRAMGISVPKMTSNTTPEGEAIASSIRTNDNDAWKAFDYDSSTQWCGKTDGTDDSPWVGYDFKKDVNIVYALYELYNSASEYGNKAFTIEALDETEWKTLYTGTTTVGKSICIPLSNNKHYQKYRIHYNGRQMTTVSLNFFGQDLDDPGLVYVDGINASTWLSKGRWTGAAYSTVDEILTDEKCVRQLITVHDSVDYLRDVCAGNEEEGLRLLSNDLIAKWVNLRDYALDTLSANAAVKAIMDKTVVEDVYVNKVPAMTSNTAPSGEAFSSSYHATAGDGPAYIAFDGSISTIWHGAANAIPAYVGYKFTNPIAITMCQFVSRDTTNYGNHSTNVKVQASNNGTDWVDLSTVKNIVENSNTKVHEIPLDNTTEYLYYRLYCVSTTYQDSSNKYFVIREVRFCVAEKKYSSKYGYGEWALVGQVPTMTSNTAPSGEAFAKSYYSGDGGWPAYMAFNSSSPKTSASQKWWASNTNDVTAYIGYDFTKEVSISGVLYQQAPEASVATVTYYSGTADVEYSNDNNIWTKVCTIEFDGTNNTHNKDFSSPISARYWRLNFSTRNCSISNGNYNVISYLQFYVWQPKGNVPVMTSNTAPYGEVSTNSAYSTTYEAYKAFNKLSTEHTDRWVTAANVTNGYLQYKFTNPICVKNISILQFTVGQVGTADYPADSTAKLQASNDGTNFVDLGTINMYASEYRDVVFYKIDNDNNYLYYRLQFNSYNLTNTGNYYNSLAELQFYGRELKISVPTMTSNTTPWGEASADSYYSESYSSYKAFDGSDSSSWISSHLVSKNYTASGWLKYDFNKSVRLKMYTVINKQKFVEYKLSGSSNGTNYTQLDEANDIAAGTITTKECDSVEAYTSYKLEMTQQYTSGSSATAALPVISTLQFYGLDYSEREFETGSTMKYIYDHGVELEAVLISNNATKEPDQLYANSGTHYWYTNQIDFTSYKLMRVYIGNSLNVLWIACMNVVPQGNNYTNNTASIDCTEALYLPYNAGLNTTSVNGVYYPTIGNYTPNTNKVTTVTEWWLE